MAELSLVVEAFKKAQGRKHHPGKPGARGSSQMPSMKGFARGAMGSMGSKFLQTRDSQAGSNKERETLQSPIFQAFLRGMVPQLPVSNFLMRNR